MEYWFYSTKIYRIALDGTVEHWSELADKWTLAITSQHVIERDGRKARLYQLPEKVR